MLGHRLRRWSNIDTALGECLHSDVNCCVLLIYTDNLCSAYNPVNTKHLYNICTMLDHKCTTSVPQVYTPCINARMFTTGYRVLTHVITPACNTRRWPNVYSVLGYRHRRWSSTDPAFSVNVWYSLG